MRVLILEIEAAGMGLALALRAQEWGHDVRFFVPPIKPDLDFGEGLVKKPDEWEPLMDGVDLVVLTGNCRYGAKLEEYFRKGYPVFGANEASAELELDRAKGQQVLEEAGVRVLPYIAVSDLNEAIDYVTKNQEPVVIKPWGGTTDKSMTCVAKTPEEAIFHLERWKDQGLQSQLMLQKKADGCEIGIAGWFSPKSGWLRMVEESWEHKRFLNDDLGQNTGEQGTVLRHVQESLLFDRVLKPLTEYLYRIGYCGDCSVNCIIDSEGNPWPLEFTARLGWPDFNIRQRVIKHDPVKWMRAMLDGRDEFNPEPLVACGVVVTHGDYPISKDSYTKWTGFPIHFPEELWPQLEWQEVKMGMKPYLENGELHHKPCLVTAGNYVVIATGCGETVLEASDQAYFAADNVRWPSNVMYRTDIGKKLEQELNILQPLGYARGLKYKP